MDAGVLAKLVLNLILVPNPAFGACGAAWASVACHVIAFTIASTALRKNIKLNLSISKILIKPVIAVAIMGICSYFTYSILTGIIAKKNGYTNSNNSSNDNLCIGNSSIKSIFKRRNITIT